MPATAAAIAASICTVTQDSLARGASRASTSAWLARLRVKLSFSRLTLRGAWKCQFRMVLVPTSRSQVVCPGHAWALAGVDGGLQARLRGREVRHRRALQGQDVRVVPVQARVPHGQEGVEARGVRVGGEGRGHVRGRLVARSLQRGDGRLGGVEPPVPEGEGGVQGRLGDQGQQGRRDLLVHVGRRGAQGHAAVEVRAIFWSTSAAVCLAAMSRACWSCVLLRP